MRPDIPLIAAVLGAGALFVEASQRTALEAPAAVAAAPATPCPDMDLHDAMNRLMFLDGGFVSGINRREADRIALPPGCAP
jgi:hypothetical protein